MADENNLTTLAKRLRPLLGNFVQGLVKSVIGEGPGIDLVVAGDITTVGLGGDTILLYHNDLTPVAEFAATEAGLIAALAAAVTGDIVILPAGTIDITGSSTPPTYEVDAEISTGAIPILDGIGTSISGLTPGNWYAIEATDGPFYLSSGTSLWSYRYRLNDGSGWSGNIGNQWNGMSLPIPGWVAHYEMVDANIVRIYFQATDTSVQIGLSDYPYDDNHGTWNWKLSSAVYTPATGINVPTGIEIVGLGDNSILDGNIINAGICTNFSVIGTISGAGINRMMHVDNAERFTRPIRITNMLSSPFQVDSSILNVNLNADLLDGYHATDFLPSGGLEGVFVIKDYGAIGDGINNDTGAIQATIDAAVDAGGGIVWLPPGIYLCDTLTLDPIVSIIGAGQDVSILKSNSAVPLLSYQNAAAHPKFDARYADFSLEGNHTGTIGMDLKGAWNFTIDHVLISHFETAGIKIRAVLVWNAYNLQIHDCVIGIDAANATIGGNNCQCNLINFYGCRIDGCSSWGMYWVGSAMLEFYGMDMELNGTYGNASTGNLYFKPASAVGFKMSGCWMENNNGKASVLIDTSESLNSHSIIEDTYCVLEAPTYGIYIEGASIGNVIICRNVVYDTSSTTKDFFADGAYATMYLQNCIGTYGGTGGIGLTPGACGARYTTNAAQSIPNITTTIIDFEDVDYDSDSAVTTGAAWKFTCPVGKGGYYQVNVNILFADSSTWAADELITLYIYKGGSSYSAIYREEWQSTTTALRQAFGSDVVHLAAGEYIDIRVYQGSGGALALYNNGVYNHVAISKL